MITLSVFLITESIESYKINETTMKKILLKPPILLMRGNVLDKVETVSQRVATFEISTQQTLLNKLINLSHFPTICDK